MTNGTTHTKSILVVDDDKGITSLLKELLEDEGYTVSVTWSAEDALQKVKKNSYDLMITDLVLPSMRGNELLKRVKARCPELPVILITAFGTMDFAVQVMREGATDFIAKPFTPQQLLLAVQRVWLNQGLRTEGDEWNTSSTSDLYLSEPPPLSVSMQRVEALARRAAATDAHILITGESGTGKTRLAHQIHLHSPRKDGPFVVLNCGAIPSSLLESELFGAIRGAFTDAKTNRTGLVESASGGTLFLDEIADLPLDAQAKMLRVLERKVIRPIGAVREISVDIRVISATHQPLEEAVAGGRFRADLYYRLHVIQLDLPPLRERIDDIPMLVDALIQDMEPHSGYTVDDEAMGWMRQWHWPGNIRELSNRLQRAIALSPEDRLHKDDVSLGTERGMTLSHGDARSETVSHHSDWVPQTLADLEQEHIERTLAFTRGNKAQAAALLGIDRRTLYRRLERIPDDDEK